MCPLRDERHGVVQRPPSARQGSVTTRPGRARRGALALEIAQRGRGRFDQAPAAARGLPADSPRAPARENTTRSAPCAAASSRMRRTSAVLPATSPTVGFSCAKAMVERHGYSARSTRWQIRCSTARCTCWISCVSREGTRMATSATRASGPFRRASQSPRRLFASPRPRPSEHWTTIRSC